MTISTASAPPMIARDEQVGVNPVLESIPQAVVTVDSRGAVDYINPAAERLFDCPAGRLRGRTFAGLLGEPDQEDYAEQLRDFGRGKPMPLTGIPREVVGRRADGSTFAMEMTLSEMPANGKRMLVAVARDIRERQWAEAQLRHLVDHDKLTGLLDRHSFERELSRHIAYAARYGNGGSVVTLGVDNFKYLNDSLGHWAGDELLRAVVRLIMDRLRRTDVLARVGGDVFAALLHGTGAEKARAVAEDLLERVRTHPFVIAGQGLRVTMSAGVASLDQRTITGAELLAETDAAMYQAKDAGRDRVAIYTPDGDADAAARRLWTERVRQATEKGLFMLVYQPIVDLQSGGTTQAELLLRMRGEEGDVIPPGAFLATAERFGLIQGIDRWVAQQAIRLIAAHRKRGRSLTLEVNLSAKTMSDSDFCVHVEREVNASGVDPSNLIFEVTETAAVADIETARRFAQTLTGLGCRFALDDFGAGFASFYYLKHLPISYLKIDGEFIRELPHTRTDQLVVQALVDVCRGLEIKTVAEFVGDQETVDMLRALRVDYAQGFYLGRPRPVAELNAGSPDVAR
jgi:diguanylate cyclase (GGDEF)-like protein/PAS domain S-box-containing protein